MGSPNFVRKVLIALSALGMLSAFQRLSADDMAVLRIDADSIVLQDSQVRTDAVLALKSKPVPGHCGMAGPILMDGEIEGTRMSWATSPRMMVNSARMAHILYL